MLFDLATEVRSGSRRSDLRGLGRRYFWSGCTFKRINKCLYDTLDLGGVEVGEKR